MSISSPKRKFIGYYPLFMLSFSLLLLISNNEAYGQSIHKYHKNIPIEARKAVNYYSKKYNLPSNLLFAIIQVESAGKKYAVSYAGAKGYMQLMFFTYLNMGYNPRRHSIYNAYYNIGAGAKYLRYLITLFKGNLKMAIACYNCGPWKKYRRKSKKRRRLKTWRNVPSVSKRYYADVWRIYRKTTTNIALDKKFIRAKQMIIVKQDLNQIIKAAPKKPLADLSIEKIINLDEQQLMQKLNDQEPDNGLWQNQLIIYLEPENDVFNH